MTGRVDLTIFLMIFVDLEMDITFPCIVRVIYIGESSQERTRIFGQGMEA